MKINGKTFQIAGDPRDQYYAHFAYHGVFTDDITEFLRRNVNPNWHCFDVGANIGLTSIFLTTLTTGVTVTAFEPSPTVFPFLLQNIDQNGLSRAIATEQVALSSKAGIAQFAELPEQLAGSYIMDLPQVHPMAVGETPKLVQTVSMDSFVASRGIDRLDLLKIDTEGHELRVLEGAHETLRRFGPITIIEFNLWMITQMQQLDPQAFLDSVFALFPYVSAINKTTGTTDLIRNSTEDRRRFVERCIEVNGSLDNLVCTSSLR